LRTLPDALLFDFDGTLIHVTIDFEAMRQNAVAVIKRYGHEPEDSRYTLELIEATRDELAQRDPERASQFEREALASIEQVEMAGAKQAVVLPSACQTLAWLREHGIRVGIVTRNCRNAVLSVLARADLTYDVLLTRDDVQNVKPNPEHLLEALRRLQALPQHSIMVGDHPTDIIAAKEAGMVAIGVTTTRSAEEFDVGPDFIIENLSDLVGIVHSGDWLQRQPGGRSK